MQCPSSYATMLILPFLPLFNPRGQISESECGLLFLSPTESLILLTDMIISDNGQLILLHTC